jgi:hypothetical protein
LGSGEREAGLILWELFLEEWDLDTYLEGGGNCGLKKRNDRIEERNDGGKGIQV